ncbi:MAG: Glutamate racemase [Pseudomonadota bacterium]|jgi:glutamate racemase
MPHTTLTASNYTQAPIGVFDSGIGGLSILKALQLHLPKERFVYYADSEYAPYGEKTDTFIQERCLAIVHELYHQHFIKALVVACNTATAVAIAQLRLSYPTMPIIGIEPALKPAVAHSITNKVIVMATRGTLSSTKFQGLLHTVQTQSPTVKIVCHACDGLAGIIEQYWFDLNHFKIHENIQQHLAAVNININLNVNSISINNNYDTLVLGCTHYPLVLNVWRQYVPAFFYIVDNGIAVAQQLQRRLKSLNLLNESNVIIQPIYLSSALNDKMNINKMFANI